MLKISCLHTSQSNIAVFEAARRALRLDDVMLKHRVRSDLLAASEAAGNATPAILEQAADELVSVGRGADGVLLTCSSIGAGARLAASRLGIPIQRTDEALARAAVSDGGPVLVLCAAGTSLAPTRALFEEAAVETGATVETRLISGVWELFKQGREDEYFRAIADAVDEAREDGATTVALAQASMAGAAALVRSDPPLTAPLAGLAAIVAAALPAGTAAAQG